MIESFLAEQVALGHFPGATYQILDSQKILRQGQVGSLSTEPCRLPLRPDAVYDVASLTKPVITATIAMLLMEQGLLKITAPIRSILPQAPWQPEITVEHLLLHTSGLPAWAPLYESPDPFSALLSTPLERPVGKIAVYSCLGFILLGRILETITTASLRELGRSLVLKPLAMQESWFSGEARGCVAPTEIDVPAGVVHDANARALGGMPGNAGLFATASDLGLYARSFLQALRGQPTLLQPDTALAMIRPRAEGLDEARTWGWMAQGRFQTSAGPCMGAQGFGHTGFTGTSLFFDPVRDRAMILLTNRVHPKVAPTPMFAIRRRFHDLCLSE